MPVTYRRATPQDIDAIVQVHNVAFPGFFLTSLGDHFLQLVYRAFLEIDSGICIVAQDGDRLHGVVAGAANPALFFATLRRRRGVRLALAAAPRLLHNPLHLVRKCVWAFFYRGEQPAAMSEAGLLSSVAVSPEVSSRGIGQQLVDTFCGELRCRRVESVYLITDQTDNELVNRFYRKCGFHLVDTIERFEKRRMNRWAKSL